MVKAAAWYPVDVRKDLELVLSALVRDGERSTRKLAEDLSLKLPRVRSAVQLLHAAGVLTVRKVWHGRQEGYERLWTFSAAGAVHLWEPVQGGRRRRLYVDRRTAIEASRRMMGPAAEARPVVVLVSCEGKVG